MERNKLLQRITIHPEICHGKPCIRDLRYPVSTILEYLAGGDTPEDILAEFEDLEAEDIQACLAFAALAVNTKGAYKVEATPISDEQMETARKRMADIKEGKVKSTSAEAVEAKLKEKFGGN